MLRSERRMPRDTFMGERLNKRPAGGPMLRKRVRCGTPVRSSGFSRLGTDPFAARKSSSLPRVSTAHRLKAELHAYGVATLVCYGLIRVAAAQSHSAGAATFF